MNFLTNRDRATSRREGRGENKEMLNPSVLEINYALSRTLVET
ncbi:hypothetical protein [Nostoc sp.]